MMHEIIVLILVLSSAYAVASYGFGIVPNLGEIADAMSSPLAFTGYTEITLYESCDDAPINFYVYGCRNEACDTYIGGSFHVSPYWIHVSNLNWYYKFCDFPKDYSAASCINANFDLNNPPTAWSGTITPYGGCPIPEPPEPTPEPIPEPTPEPTPENNLMYLWAAVILIIVVVVVLVLLVFK